MVTATQTTPGPSTSRVGWVDIVKGMSIFLVVMMHSTLGVQNAVGETSWMGAIVEFCRPFRIPCFMLVSGLFLHKTINGDWSRYLDRKVLHFVYFYVLWVALQVVVKTPAWMGEGQSGIEIAQTYLATFVQPFGTLWFIYMLPVFYLVTRMLRNQDWRLVLAAAVVLQILPIHTGSTLIDEFASRFVYFYAGYVFYQKFFIWAEFVGERFLLVAALLLVWGGANWFLTSTEFSGAGQALKLADLPVLSLGLGLVGALMMISIGSIVLRIRWLGFVRWIGEHSIVIYLAFFLPMGVARVLLLKFGTDYLSTGSIAAIVTASAFIGPIVFYWLVQKTGLGKFLFARPDAMKLNGHKNTQSAQMHPAE